MNCVLYFRLILFLIKEIIMFHRHKSSIKSTITDIENEIILDFPYLKEEVQDLSVILDYVLISKQHAFECDEYNPKPITTQESPETHEPLESLNQTKKEDEPCHNDNTLDKPQ